MLAELPTKLSSKVYDQLYGGLRYEQVRAIGFVEAIRPHAEDDFWGEEESCITLTDEFTAEAFSGICDFSRIEVLLLFHEVEPSKNHYGSASSKEQQRLADRWYLRATA